MTEFTDSYMRAEFMRSVLDLDEETIVASEGVPQVMLRQMYYTSFDTELKFVKNVLDPLFFKAFEAIETNQAPRMQAYFEAWYGNDNPGPILTSRDQFYLYLITVVPWIKESYWVNKTAVEALNLYRLYGGIQAGVGFMVKNSYHGHEAETLLGLQLFGEFKSILRQDGLL